MAKPIEEVRLKKNDGFEDLDKTIHVAVSEVKAEVRQVRLFQLDELVTLNRHATTEERIYLMLGLNCGFGPKEIATLTIGECYLDQGLPEDEQELFDFPTTNEQSFISLVRNKTTIVGKFLLFEQTATLLRDAMQSRLQRRKPGPQESLLLDPKGRRLDYRSQEGNPSRRVANQFRRLKRRCNDAGQPVSNLPFKCLRKTGGDLIRRFSDGEVSGIFLLHGSTVEQDKLADVYTNRPFGKVYRAIQEAERYLQPVFEATNGATSQDETPRTDSTAIVQLSEAGHSVRQIAERLKISKSKVQRILADID